MTSIQGLLEVLWKPRSSGVSYCIGALLSLLCASWLFDVGFLLGTREYWQTIVGDTAQHVELASLPAQFLLTCARELAGDRRALTLQFRATHRATESQSRDKRLDLGLQSLTVTAQA